MTQTAPGTNYNLPAVYSVLRTLDSDSAVVCSEIIPNIIRYIVI